MVNRRLSISGNTFWGNLEVRRYVYSMVVCFTPIVQHMIINNVTHFFCPSNKYKFAAKNDHILIFSYFGTKLNRTILKSEKQNWLLPPQVQLCHTRSLTSHNLNTQPSYIYIYIMEKTRNVLHEMLKKYAIMLSIMIQVYLHQFRF